MSNENNCNNDYKRFKKNYGNSTSNIGNKYISNELASSDLRNKINFKRAERRNKNDKEWNKERNDEIVIECNELEWRNRKVKIKNKIVFKSNDIDLYKEYVQWDFIKNKLWIQIGTFVTNNASKQKQFTNIIKNWIILINKNFSELVKYEYYKILPKIELEHPGIGILRRELIENEFVNEENADEKLRKILDFISTNHRKVIPKNLSDPLRVEYDIDLDILIVNKFKCEKLIRYKKSLSNENEIISTAGFLLREKCLENEEEGGEMKEKNCRKEKGDWNNRRNDEKEKQKRKEKSKDKEELCEIEKESEWRNRGNKIERRGEEGEESRERRDLLEGKHDKNEEKSKEKEELWEERRDCKEGELRGEKQENERVVLLGDSMELYKEYVQWDFINNKLYNKGEGLLSIRTSREKQEFTNTLQRWFIFINEDFNEVPKYENFPILPSIRLKHSAAQFLREAIIEKRFATEEDADEKMRKILGFICRSHSEVVPHGLADPLHVEHDSDRKIVVVNKFQSEEVPRVNLLVKKGGVIATARMLLRYESFGNGSYQWGDPQEVHKVLHEKFNVRYEGFASPVNSRFIEYEDAHFCSLFPETDAPFGSIGNFFYVDMKQHCGGWSVNPPFLNDLMKNVAIRINRVLDEGHKCYFFCTFPWWEDDEGWNILNNSKHLLKRFNLPPHHFIVQDAYGNKFEPKMAMNLFVMGELPSTVSRLTELGNILVHNPTMIFPENCPW